MIGIFRDAPGLGLRHGSILLLLSFQLVGTAMEIAGLAALVPVFQFIQANGDLASLTAEFRWWNALVSVYGTLGVPVTLSTLLVVSMIALLIRQAIVYMRLIYQAHIKEGLIARNRADGFSRYLSADIAYQERHDLGRIVNDLTTDLSRAVEYLFSGITLIGFGIIFIAYLVSLFVISGELTLIALAIFGVTAVAVHGQLRKTETVSSEIVEANQNMSAFLVERLKLARLVRLAGMETAESERMRQLTERQRSRMVRIFTLLANLEIIVEPLIIGAALVFLYFSVAVLDTRLEYVGLFLLLVVRLLPVVKQAARIRQAKRGTRASFLAVVSRLNEMTAARERSTGTRPLQELSQGIRFDGVTFAYPNQEPNDQDPKTNRGAALNGATVDFEAGCLTALVGPSGAGKSTLVDLIPRLRHPRSGTILIDGANIETFALDSLRAGIAYSPQSPQIFNVPVAEHIRYGKPGATLEEVRRAAELANATDFIESLPQGYDTPVGDGGERLSGGQRQRLDLARALVRQAPILILDEPTSHLDLESEAQFRDALALIRRETAITMIAIAHGLSTVAIADKIVVLKNGAVVAKGSHETLMAAGGWYADAFLKQGGRTTVVAL